MSAKENESKISEVMEEIFQGRDPQKTVKEWADEATRFVQRNPWAAVLGAAAIGFVLGSYTGRGRREDSK